MNSISEKPAKESHIDEANIRRLVDAFYAKVRVDPELGPVFNAAIGWEDADWKPHLELLYSFWSSLMLGSGRYRGNPFQKHLDLPPFDAALFDRWLALFEETARSLYEEPLAGRFVEKSRQIARSLKMGLYPDSGSGA